MSEISARCFIRRGNALIPADIMSDELLRGIKEGSGVLVSIRRPRSLQNHRLLFAVLRRVVDNTDRWADEETLLHDLKLATGLFETRVSAFSGLPYPVASSISFAALDQDRFNTWFQKAVAKLAEVLGCTEEELLAEANVNLNPTVSVVRADSDGGGNEGSEPPPSTHGGK